MSFKDILDFQIGTVWSKLRVISHRLLTPMDSDTYTLTIPALSAYGLLVIAAGLALIALYVMMLTKTGDEKQSAMERICTRLNLPLKWGWGLPPLAFLAIFVLIVGLGTAWDFAQAVFELGPYAINKASDGSAIRNIGLVLAAFIGAPFVIWRSVIAAKQADLQDQALFNDKINAATEDLAARRQVTQVVGRGAKMQVLTEWEDDLVTRAAAIDRLHGLAQERPEATPRIARQLSIYVRELSREKASQPEPMPEGATPDQLQDWAQGLKPKRQDMQLALQVLGKLQRIEGHGLSHGDVDLREANLQGFDLRDLWFEKALFGKAQMHGANLGGAQMQGANLFRAQMDGANLSEAQMQGAKLIGAQMQEANLFRAQMDGANLSEAQMQGAKLIGAQMQGADLNWAQMQGAKLIGAQMQGANLSEAQMQEADLGGAQMQGAKLIGAQMQGANLSEAQMQEADLGGAQMQGAKLIGAQMDERTDLMAATLRGAAMRSVDNTTIAQLKPFWQDVFADESVELPEDEARPAHWADEELDWDAFYEAWQAWRETLPKEA